METKGCNRFGDLNRHDPLSPSHGLNGILGAIVQVFVRSMLDIRHDLPLCTPVHAQFVRSHDARS